MFLSFCVNIDSFDGAGKPVAPQTEVTFLLTPGGGGALKQVLGLCCATGGQSQQCKVLQFLPPCMRWIITVHLFLFIFF